jgi:hypothetical protein
MNERMTVVVDPSVTAEACRKCGACCVYEVCEPCTDDGSCLSLKGKVGLHVTCTIYRQRPPECRNYMPGSQGCLDSRKAMGVA